MVSAPAPTARRRGAWRALSSEEKQARLLLLRERQRRQVEAEIRRLDALV
ncbi:hypothetical protein [Nocardioides sp. SYSU DS0663]